MKGPLWQFRALTIGNRTTHQLGQLPAGHLPLPEAAKIAAKASLPAGADVELDHRDRVKGETGVTVYTRCGNVRLSVRLIDRLPSGSISFGYSGGAIRRLVFWWWIAFAGLAYGVWNVTLLATLIEGETSHLWIATVFLIGVLAFVLAGLLLLALVWIVCDLEVQPAQWALLHRFENELVEFYTPSHDSGQQTMERNC